MLSKLNPVEVWSLRLNPSDLRNIEPTKRPANGGGQTYIQIPSRLVPATLKFLQVKKPPAQGQMISLQVKDPANPKAAPERIEFWVKSDDQGGNTRMRIARQNRHRHPRFSGWAPNAGFPKLGAGDQTPQAKAKLASVGGVRIFLARDANGVVWGGFTQGAPSLAEQKLPYAATAWAPSAGDYWP